MTAAKQEQLAHDILHTVEDTLSILDRIEENADALHDAADHREKRNAASLDIVQALSGQMDF
jgi:hypothetical protein